MGSTGTPPEHRHSLGPALPPSPRGAGVPFRVLRPSRNFLYFSTFIVLPRCSAGRHQGEDTLQPPALAPLPPPLPFGHPRPSPASPYSMISAQTSPPRQKPPPFLQMSRQLPAGTPQTAPTTCPPGAGGPGDCVSCGYFGQGARALGGEQKKKLQGLHRERHCSSGKLRTDNLMRSCAGEPQPSRGSIFGCAFARGVDTTMSCLALQSARGVRDTGGRGGETQPWRWRIALFLCHLSKEIAAG